MEHITYDLDAIDLAMTAFARAYNNGCDNLALSWSDLYDRKMSLINNIT